MRSGWAGRDVSTLLGSDDYAETGVVRDEERNGRAGHLSMGQDNAPHYIMLFHFLEGRSLKDVAC